MTGTRDALIIATGTYDDPELRRLRAPSHDADALAQVLGDPAVGGFQVRRVIDQPAGLIGRAAQEFFADRGLDDLLLVHLSCHGVKDDDGRLYFAATDTEKKWLASTAISAAFLSDLMDHCRARSVVLLLDCCYSGAFVSGAKGDEGVHLKEKFEGEGRAILTASNAIEYSWEGDDLSGEGAPSVFTAAVVEGLETGDADRDRDGMVSVEDLYKHVYERVRASQPGQTPKMWALGIEHDLYVARNPRPIQVEPAALPPELRVALESPLPSVRAGIIEDLSRLLSSSNAGMVLAARQALEQLVDDDSRKVSEMARSALEIHSSPQAPPHDRREVVGPENSEEAERKQREDAERQELEEAKRKQREEAERQELEEAKRKQREEAETRDRSPSQKEEAPPDRVQLPPVTGSVATAQKLIPTLEQALHKDEKVTSLFTMTFPSLIGKHFDALLAFTETSILLIGDRGVFRSIPDFIGRVDYSAIREVKARRSMLMGSGIFFQVKLVHRDAGTGNLKTGTLGYTAKEPANEIVAFIRDRLS